MRRIARSLRRSWNSGWSSRFCAPAAAISGSSVWRACAKTAHRLADLAAHRQLGADRVEVGRGDVLHDPPAEPRVEGVGEPGQVVGGDLAAPLEDALRGDAAGGDHHRHAGARREPDQLDVLEGVAVARGRDRDGQVAGESGEQAGGLLDHVAQVARGFAELVADAAGVVLGEGLGLQQPVDVGAVAGVGGDAAGRGVRLDQVAERLQLGHLVADRRRGDAQVVLLRERDRADRFRRVDVLVHDGRQDEGLSLVELALLVHGGFSSPRRRVPGVSSAYHPGRRGSRRALASRRVKVAVASESTMP